MYSDIVGSQMCTFGDGKCLTVRSIGALSGVQPRRKYIHVHFNKISN